SRSFETLQKKLLPSCEKARAERAETEMAARAAVEDVELNRRAYLSLIVKLSFEIVMGALGVQPNFRAIFERREALFYPEHALEYNLERYSSPEMAGFDELHEEGRMEQAPVAFGEIERFLRVVFQGAREVGPPGSAAGVKRRKRP